MGVMINVKQGITTMKGIKWAGFLEVKLFSKSKLWFCSACSYF
jgi:hypothetical protein